MQTDQLSKYQPILVTGATGHTGRRLVQALLDKGVRVRILTRDPARFSLELRRKVEDNMARGLLDCVVATSSLDLGIDWAEVDLVVINGGKVNLTGTETVDKLYFGGVQQPAGSYTTASDSTHFSGSGTLVVTSGPSPAGFATWAAANGATGQTASDDHDKDGVANGI